MNGNQPNTSEAPTTEGITPGPWLLQRNNSREEYRLLVQPQNPGAVGYYEIAKMDFGFTEPFESQQHANARLIAAAPELLEALKRMYLACTGFSCIPSDEDLAYAAQAVAKAEDRS